MLKHISSEFQRGPSEKISGLSLKSTEPVTQEFVTKMINFFKTNQCKNIVPLKTCRKIISDAEKVLCQMPSLLEIDVAEDEDIVIVGDIHGQLFDLLNIVDLVGEPTKKKKFIFNGDFVDRGAWGMECLLILLGNCQIN